MGESNRSAPSAQESDPTETSMSPVMSKDEQDRAIRVRNLKESASYRQAHLDPDFMTSDELRPVRLQLEMMKPETMKGLSCLKVRILQEIM